MDVPRETHLTRRQRLKRRLEEGPATLRDLATELRLGIKQTAAELDHLAKSLKPRRISVEPPSCQSCGYVFTERTRWTTPSRCPKCRSERIEEALFQL